MQLKVPTNVTETSMNKQFASESSAVCVFCVGGRLSGYKMKAARKKSSLLM